MLVFEERGKLEYLEKNLLEQGENQRETQPTCDAGSGNQTRTTFHLVGGEHSHHCATLGFIWKIASQQLVAGSGVTYPIIYNLNMLLTSCKLCSDSCALSLEI